MNKDTLKFLWQLYADLISQKEEQAAEDYPSYDIDRIMKKLKDRIDQELE